MSLTEFSETLSDEERRALGSALFTVLFLVSGADGTSTRGEVTALERAVAGLDAAFGEGHARALDLSPAAFSRAMREAEGLGFHLLRSELTVARGVLDRMPRPLRDRYEAYLLDACLQVAEASGGFLGLGSRINEDERLMIGEIVRTLGLRVTDAAAREKLGM
jgi:hypothetical protein